MGPTLLVAVHDDGQHPANAQSPWNPVEWHTYSNCSLHCQCHTTSTVHDTRLVPCAAPALLDAARPLRLRLRLHNGRQRSAWTIAPSGSLALSPSTHRHPMRRTQCHTTGPDATQHVRAEVYRGTPWCTAYLCQREVRGPYPCAEDRRVWPPYCISEQYGGHTRLSAAHGHANQSERGPQDEESTEPKQVYSGS